MVQKRIALVLHGTLDRSYISCLSVRQVAQIFKLVDFSGRHIAHDFLLKMMIQAAQPNPIAEATLTAIANRVHRLTTRYPHRAHAGGRYRLKLRKLARDLSDIGCAERSSPIGAKRRGLLARGHL